MSRPSVSVLIPTYNYARYLTETLESVFAQDLTSLEIIVSDDASTDETDEVMRSLVKRDSRIIYTRHDENMGMVENWNWCIRQASGTFVKLLLADDKLNRSDSLTRMADGLEANPEAALAVSARSIINEDSAEIQVVQALGKEDHIFSNDWMIRRYLDRDAKHVNPIGEPSAVMFRRVLGSRGFDPAYRQLVDVEMWFHLLAQGNLVYTAEPLCCFRRHRDQQTEVNKRQFLHQQEELALCRRYSHASALKRVLFHKMYRISKLHEPELVEVLASLRAEYTPLEYAFRMAEYKITRPFVNARRSILKRLQGDSFLEH